MVSLKTVFKKLKEVHNDKIQSRVIYNTKQNFIILISFGNTYFYSVLEFISGVNSMHEKNGMEVILSHTATEVEQTEDEDNYSKKPIEMINDRYYLLISGTTKQYQRLFDIVPQSNDVLKVITNDIYHCCCSTDFDYLIELGVLNLNRFKYQNIVPDTYDEYKSYYSCLTVNGEYDDFDKIMLRLPALFSAIDVAKIINVYPKINGESVITNIPQLIDWLNGKQEKKSCVNFTALSSEDGLKTYECLKEPLLSHIIPNPDLDILSVISAPVFMREDLTEEDRINGDIPVEKMDELFQQDYDRFTQPTADYTEGGYELIDEQLS